MSEITSFWLFASAFCVGLGFRFGWEYAEALIVCVGRVIEWLFSGDRERRRLTR